MEDKPVNIIKDISWRFGVHVASSGTHDVGKNYLQMKIIYNENGEIKSIFSEMDLSQFYKFFHDLEKAKHVLDIEI